MFGNAVCGCWNFFSTYLQADTLLVYVWSGFHILVRIFHVGRKWLSFWRSWSFWPRWFGLIYYCQSTWFGRKLRDGFAEMGMSLTEIVWAKIYVLQNTVISSIVLIGFLSQFIVTVHCRPNWTYCNCMIGFVQVLFHKVHISSHWM